jgi:hypothetical protein
MKPAINSFRKAFALASVVALLVVSQPAQSRAGAVAVRQKATFTISSLGTPFGVQVKFEGTYTVNETYVEVDVERAYIYVSEHCPYKGRRFVNTLVVGLATKTPSGRWDIETRSLPVYVEHVMAPRDEYKLAGLHFQIPRNAGTDLSERWLVVVTEETSLDVPDHDPDATGYHLAHSRRDIFAVRDVRQAQP